MAQKTKNTQKSEPKNTKSTDNSPLRNFVDRFSNWKSFAALLVAVTFGVVGWFYLFPSDAATACRTKTFRRGSTGQCVEIIQWSVGVYPASKAAGKGTYGPQTEAAVKRWQSARRLSADGVFGKNSWNKFCGERRYPQDKAVAKVVGCTLYGNGYYK